MTYNKKKAVDLLTKYAQDKIVDALEDQNSYFKAFAGPPRERTREELLKENVELWKRLEAIHEAIGPGFCYDD